MTLSVIIPTRNRARHVVQAVNSVLTQRSDQFDLIVVDDGSTDDTASRLNPLCPDPRFRLIHQESQGAAVARNTGAELARGDWLLFLDSDDLLAGDAISRLLQITATHPAAAVICTSAEEISESGDLLKKTSPRPLGAAYHNIHGQFLAGTFAVDRRLFLGIGGFATRCRSSQHTELALRLVEECTQRGKEVWCEDVVTVQIRRHDDGHLRDDPQRLFDGAEFIISAHRDKLRRKPQQLADWHTVAGIYATRLRLPSAARRHFGQACRLHLARPRRIARWLISCMPALARRVWGTTHGRPAHAQGRRDDA